MVLTARSKKSYFLELKQELFAVLREEGGLSYG